MPPSHRPLLGRGPTGKDKPVYPPKPYPLSEHSKAPGSSFQRTGSPSTDPSSAHTTSSASPTASQVWGDMNMQQQMLPSVWSAMDEEQNALSGNALAARSPSTITLPKPAPFPIAPIGSHPSPPLRQLSAAENAFFQSSSNSENYTPGSPAFALRDLRDQDAYHASQYPSHVGAFSAPYQPLHNASVEMPMSTQAYSNHHAPSPPSRESSVGSISGHRRTVTTPDVHAMNVHNGYPAQLPHPHLRHPGDARSSLSHHIPNIVHSGPFNS